MSEKGPESDVEPRRVHVTEVPLADIRRPSHGTLASAYRCQVTGKIFAAALMVAFIFEGDFELRAVSVDLTVADD
jgi:hypothetical protein